MKKIYVFIVSCANSQVLACPAKHSAVALVLDLAIQRRWIQIRFLFVCMCVWTLVKYKATWKDGEIFSQVFLQWKEVYKTHPDDEQQLTVHYFLEKTWSWLPCRSESIKTELLTIAFLSCWSLGLNPNFIRPEKKRIMRTIEVLEVDLGLMCRGCKSCQRAWLIGSHALVPSAKH